MAINRAPWTALVDDDGSNTTGSLWNKTAIKDVLLDPIDVALGVWSLQPFVASKFWTGVLTGHVTMDYIAVTGKTVFWIVQIVGAPAPAATPYLTLTIPGGDTGNSLFRGNGCLAPCAYATENGTYVPAFGFALGPQQIGIAKSTFTNWAAGPVNMYISMIVSLA